MGTDIFVFGEKRNSEGLWEYVECDYAVRHYGLFGWLADVRNYSRIKPLYPMRYFPENCSNEIKDNCENLHSITYYSLQELLDVDYSQIITDQRGPGEDEKRTLRDFLGIEWFKFLDELKDKHVERITMGFA